MTRSFNEKPTTMVAKDAAPGGGKAPSVAENTGRAAIAASPP